MQNPEDFQNPEFLANEWRKQTQKFIDLKFHTELGLSEEDYLESLPKFSKQPEKFRGEYDIPLIVDTRLPLDSLLNAEGITRLDKEDPIVDLVEVPKDPYVIWVSKNKYFQEDLRTIREHLTSDERGGTVIEGVYLYLRDPDIIQVHPKTDDPRIVFPGSACYFRGEKEREKRLFLGVYIGRVTMTHNADGVFMATHGNVPIIVGKE